MAWNDYDLRGEVLAEFAQFGDTSRSSLADFTQAGLAGLTVVLPVNEAACSDRDKAKSMRRSAELKKEKLSRPRKCAYIKCNIDLTLRKSNAEYCSQKHRLLERYRTSEKAELPERKCPICGGAFKKRKDAKACSKSCSSKLLRREQRAS